MTGQKSFRYQPCVAVSGNPAVKVPVLDDMLSSHEQENYPTTSLDENSIEFELQTDRNLSCFKSKLIKGRGFDTYKTTKKKMSTKTTLFLLKQATMTLI